MPSQGPNVPTIAEPEFDGNPAINNIANVFAEDGVFASVAGRADVSVLVRGFGFSLPSSSVVNGVVVEVKGYANGITILPDARLVNFNNAFWSFVKNFNLPTINGYVSIGSNTDLWGDDLNLDAGFINSNDFSVWLRLSSNSSSSIFIDHVRVTVYYEQPSISTTFLALL